MSPGNDSPRRAFPAWLPVIALSLLGFWLRWRGLPGTWGSDALTSFETCRDGAAGSVDPRANRWLALFVVKTSLAAGDFAPAAASLPGVILAALVPPVLWIGLRRRLGDGVALLPAALFAFLGLSFEECAEISTDVMTALPAALATAALALAADDPARRTRRLLAAGAALGVGCVVKETMLFTLVGFAAGALCLGRGRERVRSATFVAVPALALFALSLLVADPRRVENASNYMSWDAAFNPAGPAAMLRRLTIALPSALLTATQAYGFLFVVALPLLVRLPWRAARGDALAVAATVGFLAFMLLPISFSTWALLPAERPRYLLAWIPVMLAALAATLRDAPASRSERYAALLAAAAGLAFARASPLAMVLVPAGLIATAWSSLPAAIATSVAERTRLGAAGALILAASVAWPRLGGTPETVDWIVAAGVAVLVTAPWLLGRERESPLPSFAACGAIVLAIASTRARFSPDPSWTAWEVLPPKGRVYAETLVARRLRAAAASAGADASRVVALDVHDDPPAALSPDDRVVAESDGPLTGGLRLADRCRMPGSPVEAGPSLGNTVVFVPANR